MSLRFDQPEFLAAGLLGLPLAILGWRWLTALDRPRRATVIGLRAAPLLCLAVMLAGPRTVREHDDLTVIGVLDLSGSVKRFARLPEVPDLQRRSTVEYVRQWFRAATETRAADEVLSGVGDVLGELGDEVQGVEDQPGDRLRRHLWRPDQRHPLWRSALADRPAGAGSRRRARCHPRAPVRRAIGAPGDRRPAPGERCRHPRRRAVFRRGAVHHPRRAA